MKFYKVCLRLSLLQVQKCTQSSKYADVNSQSAQASDINEESRFGDSQENKGLWKTGEYKTMQRSHHLLSYLIIRMWKCLSSIVRSSHFARGAKILIFQISSFFKGS